MPARVRPHDWDYYFRPNAPRRGGPLQAFIHMFVLILIVGLCTFGMIFALRYNEKRLSALTETQEAQATVEAEAAALDSAAQEAEVPPIEQTLGNGSVVASGNLRREPAVITPETVIGQICLGDTITFLDQQTINGAIWYRIRVTNLAASCDPQRVGPNTEGWAHNSLLSAPAP